VEHIVVHTLILGVIGRKIAYHLLRARFVEGRLGKIPDHRVGIQAFYLFGYGCVVATYEYMYTLDVYE
jgi:hypothetical protein